MYLLLLILAICGMGSVCMCSGVEHGRVGYVFRGIIANDVGWVYFCSRGNRGVVCNKLRLFAETSVV